jgi:uncharacterized RDD family membrane protein YckC
MSRSARYCERSIHWLRCLAIDGLIVRTQRTLSAPSNLARNRTFNIVCQTGAIHSQQAGAAMSEAATGGWHFTIGQQQYGPVPLDELKQRVAGGQVTGTDMIWQEGMATWQPVSTMPHLFPAVQTPLSYAAPAVYMDPNAAEYVGFWWRVLAYMIDYFVLLVPSLIISFITTAGGSRSPSSAEVGLQLIGSVLNLVMGWLYHAGMESSTKQATLGKLACGLVVTDMNGARLSFGRATGRYFAKILSALILCIGFIMVAFTQKKQGLHDMIASTLVVKKRTY